MKTPMLDEALRFVFALLIFSCVTANGTEPPAAPTVTDVTETSISLQWPDTDFCHVVQKLVVFNPISQQWVNATDCLTTTSVTFDELTPGDFYSYRLVAFDAAGTASLPRSSGSSPH